MNSIKTVLITGASRGIGKATALKFAKAGYHTIINAHKSANDLLEVAAQIKEIAPSNVKCLPIVADVSDYFQVQNMFEEINLLFSGVDVLINNAGTSQYQLLTDTSINEWHHLMDTNLNSAFYVTKQVLPYMLHEHGGSIVNISSIWGSVGAAMEVAYSTAKAGLHGFTKALAKEVGPSQIRVNAIACGAINTLMNSHLSHEDRDTLTENIALCRMGTPEEVAEIIFHTAVTATYMTGEILHYDGGY